MKKKSPKTIFESKAADKREKLADTNTRQFAKEMASLSLIAQRRVVGSSLVARRTIATSWRGSTFMYQASLPRLPIPPLDKVRQNFCCLLSRFFCGALNQTCLFKINPNRPLCSNKKNKQTNHSTTKLNCHTHTHTHTHNRLCIVICAWSSLF